MLVVPSMQAATSKRFITTMRSSPLSRFFSALLHEAGGAVGGVGDIGDLEPILSATEYRIGDYLTVRIRIRGRIDRAPFMK